MHLWAVYFHGIVVWVAMVAQLQFKKKQTTAKKRSQARSNEDKSGKK
jgi:hypothetical protein